MEKYYFLFALALLWIIFASLQDLKKREVANWLTFSLVGFALAYRALYSSFFSDWGFLALGLIGFALFYCLANLFYYARVFAGGDAKLLIGMGTILPFENYIDYLWIGGGFIVLLFSVGAIYSFIYSLFLIAGNRRRFSKEFRKHFRDRRNWWIALLLALVIFILFYLAVGFDMFLVIGAIVLALVSFLLLSYAKSVETCMIKLVPARKLTEGDWLVGDVRVGRSVIRKSVHGLSVEEIVRLRKAGKKVLIRGGIPFVPVFLISFVIMLFFLVV